MELLHSIKKQRELFSQTLSTAKMPKDLTLQIPISCDEETSTEQYNGNSATSGPDNTTRKALSPSKGNQGLGNARMLVSSLRSKREDLIKRFENSQLTTCKASSSPSPSENEENNSGAREIQFESPFSSPEVDLCRAGKEKNDTRRSFVKGSESAGFQGTPSRQGLKPSVAPSSRAFERTGLSSNEKPTISRNPAVKADDKQWIKKSDGDDSLSNLTDTPAGGLETVFRGTSSTGPSSSEAIKARKGGLSMDGSWIRRYGSTDEDQQDGSTSEDSSSKKPANLDITKGTKEKEGCNTEEQINKVFSPKRRQKETSEFAEGDGAQRKTEDPIWVKRKAEPTKIPAFSTKNMPPGISSGEKRRNGSNGASWIKKPEGESSNVPESTPQSPVLLKPSIVRIEQSAKRTSTTLAVSRLNLSERANSEGTLQVQQKEVDTAWIKHSRESTNESEHSTVSHSSVKRNCGGGVPPTMKDRTQLQVYQAGTRRRSTGDVSWIKEPSVTNVGKTVSSLPKAPWVQALELGDKSCNVAPSMLLNNKKRNFDRSVFRNNGPHSGRLFSGPVTPGGSKPSFRLSAETVRESSGCEANGDRQVFRNTSESDGVNQAGDHEPQKKPFDTKVLLLESKEAVSSSVATPAAGVKAAKQYWESPQRKSCPGSVSRTEITEKKANISSIIDAMEKFSMGNELELARTAEEPDEEEKEEQLKEEDNSQASYQSEAERWTSNSCASAEDSIALEYGDASFPLASGSQEEYYEGRENELNFEKYDDASEGSTYKIDNYQKDFNQPIPINSPWMNMGHDRFTSGFGIDRGAMAIVSVVPSTEQRQSYDDEQGFYTVQSTRQETSIGEERQPTDRSLATSQSNQKVARNCLLSAKKKVPSRTRSAMCFAETKADPIFQVAGDSEEKMMQNIIKILAKSGDGEIEFEHVVNKPSKSMFKKLKKGLGSTLSRGKDSNDLASVYAPEDDSVEVVCRDSRTTVSSITRSVTSNRTDFSQKSGENKSMPLGVLNGFFKAARKLQQNAKRKTKTHRRGRSMSIYENPTERAGPATATDSKPTQAITIRPPLAQSQQAQPWPGIQSPTSGREPEPAAVTDRRFGAYGGLATTRQLALDAPNQAIKSLASW